jgi:hypothetical protein
MVDISLTLFSDMIMILRKRKGSARQLYRDPIPLEEVLFLDFPCKGIYLYAAGKECLSKL